MLTLRLDGRKFRLPARWEEITLAQCAWLYRKVQEQSPALVDYYRAFASQTAPEPYEDTDELTRFTAEVVGYLTGMPRELMLQTHRSDVMGLALSVLPRFVLGMLGAVDYPVQGIASFRHGSSRYHLPKSGMDISGEPTPLSTLTAIEFCQLSDLAAGGNLSMAPLAVAIACRRKGEPYDEAAAQARAARFGDLPASLYWELWSLVSAAHQYLKTAFPACYGKGGDGNEAVAESGAWCNTLVSMAADRPSELAQLQRMNAYDFMHLLSENIKRKTEEWKMKTALAGCGAG